MQIICVENNVFVDWLKSIYWAFWADGYANSVEQSFLGNKQCTSNSCPLFLPYIWFGVLALLIGE